MRQGQGRVKGKEGITGDKSSSEVKKRVQLKTKERKGK